MTPQYTKLKALLQELFQLDQPDLDFGLYRVMHAKRDEVTTFLDRDLLPQVQGAFAQYQSADKAEIEKELAKVTAGVEAAGLLPDDSPKVRQLRAKLASEAVDVRTVEREVYDHLYSFFRRYYSEGDYLAKRVYKPGVYAIPYEGEEVTLHWANKDQYYIKTSEYLRDYAFRLRPSDEVNPMRVHFRLVDAAEGEHGNVKVAEVKERRFKLASEQPMAVENGELVIRFTYLPDAKKQTELNTAAEAAVLANTDATFTDWVAALGALAPTEKDAKRTVLAKHLKGYSDRNTFDYFIHKDLGGFLRRELDFYIKNEVMHLDDVENETAPRVEQYLSKIKVVRRIAGKIIDFLAQLEDFQKKLWLKKKFVVETSWCIRIGVIPEEFYPEIAANEAQREEWVRLCAIDELAGDLMSAAYSAPVSSSFLTTHPSLVVDTRFFSADFTARVFGSLESISEQIDGTLIHSDNFQALLLGQNALRERVKCMYIDPPYNTGGDGFAYKDAYQHSSWMSMMADRLQLAFRLLSQSAGAAVNLNDIEDWRMRAIIESSFGVESYVTTVITKCSTPSSFRTVNTGPVDVTDRIILFAKNREKYVFSPQPVEKSVDLQHFGRFVDNFNEAPAQWRFKPIRLEVLQQLGFNCESSQEGMRLAQEKWGTAARAVVDSACEVFALHNADRVFELKTLQKPSQWLVEHINASKALRDQVYVAHRENAEPIIMMGGRQFYFLGKGVVTINGQRRVSEPASTLWTDIDTNNLRHEGDVEFPSGKKPVKLLARLLRMSDSADGDWCLDFFSGSGSTGHAVININREDGGRRKFILVEMGDYFDTVLLPRIKKITYTPEWKDGKPKRLATKEEAERGPRIVKVVRLESYEDALNNLEARRTGAQQLLLDAPEAQGADGLKEQYILRYMLDVETRGSQSLLNVQAFTDPTAYKLKVKRPGSDESREVNVDLLETFNWLIGLTVRHLAAPQTFSAAFVRDSEGRLQLKDSRIKQEIAGPHWFRTVTGTTPDGRKALVVWRKLTGNAEQDNLVLDEWFAKQGYSARDAEFDVIWVNGGNNLENLKTPDDRWKVRLIEEDFHRLMFEGTE
jgi:adenine-specific DNA-methyltransferase